jgi:hypothetical protein
MGSFTQITTRSSVTMQAVVNLDLMTQGIYQFYEALRFAWNTYMMLIPAVMLRVLTIYPERPLTL